MGKEYIREMLQSGEAHHIGSIHYTENFESGITWEHDGNAGNYLVDWNKDEALMGKYSAHMQTRTVGAALDDWVSIENPIYLPYNKRLSVWTFFRVPYFLTCEYLEWQLTWYDGTTVHYATFFYDPVAEIWQYADSSGVTQNITGSDQALYPDTWHKVKFSIDFEADEYLELWCNTMRVDMRGIALETDTSGVAENFWIVLYATASAVGYTDIYIDDMMVTEYGIE